MGRCDSARVLGTAIAASMKTWRRCAATCTHRLGALGTRCSARSVPVSIGRNTVQQHIHQHIRDFIAVDIDVREGRLVDLSARSGFLRRDSGISQELYVDPRTGLIRQNKGYSSWRHGAAERRRREQIEIETRRRIVDERTFLLLLDDVWFRVEVDVLPKERFVENVVDSKPHKHVIAEPRYDVVLKRNISRAMRADLQQCKHLYGSGDLYAVSKRQLSTREIKAHRLR